MTRINCVPVTELSRAHLLAEYRELPRISALARKVVNAPKEYCLGKGHVLFFYDKGEWLRKRFEQEIVPELKSRNIKPKYETYRTHPEGLNKDWNPREQDLELNRQRIAERLGSRREAV